MASHSVIRFSIDHNEEDRRIFCVLEQDAGGYFWRCEDDGHDASDGERYASREAAIADAPRIWRGVWNFEWVDA
jgi:hypothetical protein